MNKWLMRLITFTITYCIAGHHTATWRLTAAHQGLGDWSRWDDQGRHHHDIDSMRAQLLRHTRLSCWKARWTMLDRYSHRCNAGVFVQEHYFRRGEDGCQVVFADCIGWAWIWLADVYFCLKLNSNMCVIRYSSTNRKIRANCGEQIDHQEEAVAMWRESTGEAWKAGRRWERFYPAADRLLRQVEFGQLLWVSI